MCNISILVHDMTLSIIIDSYSITSVITASSVGHTRLRNNAPSNLPPLTCLSELYNTSDVNITNLRYSYSRIIYNIQLDSILPGYNNSAHVAHLDLAA